MYLMPGARQNLDDQAAYFRIIIKDQDFCHEIYLLVLSHLARIDLRQPCAWGRFSIRMSIVSTVSTPPMVRSPGFTGPTPAGGPERIRAPGCSAYRREG